MFLSFCFSAVIHSPLCNHNQREYNVAYVIRFICVSIFSNMHDEKVEAHHHNIHFHLLPCVKKRLLETEKNHKTVKLYICCKKA